MIAGLVQFYILAGIASFLLVPVIFGLWVLYGLMVDLFHFLWRGR